MENLQFDTTGLTVAVKYEQLQQIIKECVTDGIEEFIKNKNKYVEQKWVKSKDAAKLLKCNVSTINRWKHSGYLTPKTIGGKDYYYLEEIYNILGVA